MEEVCLAIAPEHLLSFCTQLQKQGCDVIAVNSLITPKNFVWISNSPMLQSQLVPMPSGWTCGGFEVEQVPGKSKGRLTKVLRKKSYYDLTLELAKYPGQNIAWSSPTSLDSTKYIYTS